MTAPQLKTYVSGQTAPVTADNFNTFQQTCDNLTQLGGFIGISGVQVYVRGTAAPGDGGQGVFYWDSTATGPSNGTTIIVPTGAGVGAWVRLSNDATFTKLGYYNLLNFGGVGDGLVNNYAAFVAAFTAIAAAGGGMLFIPTGTYVIASATVSAPLAVPNNTVVQGCGEGQTVIDLMGSTQVNDLFVATNPNNVWFNDLTITGNSVFALSASISDGGAVQFIMNSGATGNCYNFGLKRCTLSNFKNSCWIACYNAGNSSNYSLNDFHVEDCSFFSLTGNLNGGSSSAYPSTMISVVGTNSGTTQTGPVNGVWIKDNYADGTHVKRFCDIWSCVSDVWIENPDLDNFGADASNDSGAYAILVYDNAAALGGNINTRPTNVWISNPAIFHPRTCGIYCASGVNVMTYSPSVSGQYDTTAGSLLYGGIVYNQTSGGIIDAELTNCFRGVGYIAADNGSMAINGTEIVSSFTGSESVTITVHADPAAGFVPILGIEQLHVVNTGANSVAMRLLGSTGATAGLIKITDSVLSGTQNCIFMDDGSSSSYVGLSLELLNVTLNGAFASRAFYAPGTTSCAISFYNVTLDGTNITGNPDGIVLDGATKVQVDGLCLRNFTSGTGKALSTVGTQGTMRDVQFQNVSSTRRYYTTGTPLGNAAPAYTWDQGGYVQNLNPVEAGSAASKYIVQGWTNTDGATTWLPVRTLTGN